MRAISPFASTRSGPTLEKHPRHAAPWPGSACGGMERVARVAHTLSFMYAPHEHAQVLCHRVLSKACPGFLTVPQGGMSAPPAAYLLNGGTIEGAQAIAAHESPRTTKLYDRTADEITLDEVERIAI